MEHEKLQVSLRAGASLGSFHKLISSVIAAIYAALVAGVSLLGSITTLVHLLEKLLSMLEAE